MTIYIESFLLQNVSINFCLFKLIHVTTKSQTSFFKMLTASIVGATPSIIAIIILNNTFALNIIKIISSVVMVMLAFKQSKKQFVFNIILLFLYTYAFGGIITSLSSATYYTSFGAVMTSKFSLELICVLIIIFTYIFELVANHLKLKFNTNSLIYNITLKQANRTIKINAYLDTGNFLNHNGQPVLILDLQTYLDLTKKNLLDFLTLKSEAIQTQTVSGQNNLKLFKIDEIKFKNGKNTIRLTSPLVAINTSNCFKNTNYKALLSPLFL